MTPMSLHNSAQRRDLSEITMDQKIKSNISEDEGDGGGDWSSVTCIIQWSE